MGFELAFTSAQKCTVLRRTPPRTPPKKTYRHGFGCVFPTRRSLAFGGVSYSWNVRWNARSTGPAAQYGPARPSTSSSELTREPENERTEGYHRCLHLLQQRSEPPGRVLSTALCCRPGRRRSKEGTARWSFSSPRRKCVASVLPLSAASPPKLPKESTCLNCRCSFYEKGKCSSETCRPGEIRNSPVP